MAREQAATQPVDEAAELRQQIEVLALRAKRRLLEQLAGTPRPVREANEFSATNANFVDPSEAYYDSPDFFYPPYAQLESQVPQNYEVQNRGENLPFFVTEHQLKQIRDISRRLCGYNPFAISALSNRAGYLVGEGILYTVKRRDDEDSEDDPLCQAAQQVVDYFIDTNDWNDLEQEIVERCDRDGEAFLRLFAQPDGSTIVREIEPEHVRAYYQEGQERQYLFGVETAYDDIQDIQAYWLVSDPLKGMVADERVDPSEIIHIRLNSVRNAKRGLPTFFPIRHSFDRALKLLRNMSVLAQTRATFSAIRSHDGYSVAAVQAFVDAQVDQSVQTGLTSRPQNFSYYQPGTILDAPKGTTYEFPADGVNAASYVDILQAELRAIASALVMPEWMLSANVADMAAYTASLVAESPSVKNFTRLRKKFMRAFGEGVFCDSSYGRKSGLMWRVLKNAVVAGKIPADVLRACKIEAEGPSLVVQNKVEETQKDQILHSAGVLSAQTWAAQSGLDYAKERANLDAEMEANGPMLQDLQLPPDGNPPDATREPRSAA